jgi:hypothetical protein
VTYGFFLTVFEESSRYKIISVDMARLCAYLRMSGIYCFLIKKYGNPFPKIFSDIKKIMLIGHKITS